MQRSFAATTIVNVSFTACLFCTAASAQVSYLSQARRVNAYASNMGFVQQIADAPDFAPWSAAVEAISPPPPAPMPNIGRASQTSRLDPLGIFAFGSTFGEDNVFPGGGEGVGRSTMDIHFTLSAASSAVIRAQILKISGSSVQGALVKLSRGATVLYDHSYQGGLTVAPLMLEPGEYRLEFLAAAGWVGGQTGFSGTDYDFALIVPAPGAPALSLVGVAVLGSRRRRGVR